MLIAALCVPGVAGAQGAAPPLETLVIVRAERLPSSQGDASFQPISLSQTVLRSSARLDDALRQVPGFSLFRRSSSASANPTIQGASLRGIGPNGAGRALVTLDGIPQNDPFGGWVYWSRFPSEGLESATILRGAGAGSYGAGVLTGVIVLEARRPEAGNYSFFASSGSLGTNAAGFIGTIGTPSGGLTLAASGEQSEGWIPVQASQRGLIDRAAFLETAAFAATAWGKAGDNGQFSAVFASFEEKRGAGTALADSRARGTDVSFAVSTRTGQTRWRFQAYGQQRDLANRTASVASGRAIVTPALDQVSTPATGWGASITAMRSGPITWEVGADVRAVQGETRERFRFLNGQFTRDRRAGGEQIIAGAFGSLGSNQGPWFFSATARADHWSRSGAFRLENDSQTGLATLTSRAPNASGTALSGRLGARFTQDNAIYYRAATYAGFRPPSLNELHRPFRVGNDVTEANPLLLPETLIGAEMGIGGSATRFNWSATAFWNRVENPISNVTLGLGPGTFPLTGFIPAGGSYRERQNVGTIEASGLEAEAAWTVSETVSLRLAYSGTHSEIDGGAILPALTDKRPPQTPRHAGSLSIKWTPSTHWNFDLTARGESDRFEDDQNIRILKGGTTIDARLERLFGHLGGFLAVENLLDTSLATGQTGDGTISLASPRVVRIGFVVRGN